MFRRRYRRIIWFFARIVANLLYSELLLPRLGMRKRAERQIRIAVRFRTLLEQVHKARLCRDEGAEPDPDALCEVIVKVQRPHIEQIVAVDLAALRIVSRWMKRYPPIRRRADVEALLGEWRLCWCSWSAASWACRRRAWSGVLTGWSGAFSALPGRWSGSR